MSINPAHETKEKVNILFDFIPAVEVEGVGLDFTLQIQTPVTFGVMEAR